MKEITFKVETITPELATAYLANNKVHRKIQKRVVSRYADTMKRGNWVLTHQGIAFDNEGYLIDGQHRLEAVVQSGQVISIVVARYNVQLPWHIFDASEKI